MKNRNGTTNYDPTTDEGRKAFVNKLHKKHESRKRKRVAGLLAAAAVGTGAIFGAAEAGTSAHNYVAGIEKNNNTMEQPQNKIENEGTFTYVVQQGDAVWDLIKQFYGEKYDANYIMALTEDLTKRYNPDFSTANIQPGQEIYFPVLD